MTVSKRTRFEVLKRDGFRCQYCGLKGTETGAGLTVDHVVPTTLGGDDAPTNLVAACRDCNAGKSSASLTDSPVPAAVPAETQALAVAQRSAQIRADLHAFDDLVDEFDTIWRSWCRGGKPENTIPRPHDWESSVAHLAKQGAPIDVFEYAIPIAMKRANTRQGGEHAQFVYMLAIVRNKMLDHPLDFTVTSATAKVYTAEDLASEGERGWMAAWGDGYRAGQKHERENPAIVQFVDALVTADSETQPRETYF